jgi:polysaccharide pyruvyl transferase WcaK-like protein
VKRRIVIAGAYGIQNAGDDAPLLVLARSLRARYPEAELQLDVLARHPDPLLAEASGARFLANPEYPSRAAARGKHFRGLNPGDDRADLERLEDAIRGADLVVAGAGNVLVDLALDLFRGPVPLLALYAFLADVHRVPLMLYGISAGPLATSRGRELSAWIARRAAAITVRDEGSRALLTELDPECDPELLPDPVLGLAPASDARFEEALAAERIPRQGARPRLALALRDLGFLGRSRDAVVAALRRLSGRFELLFVPQSTYAEDDDRAEAEAVVRALGDVPALEVCGRHAPDVLMRFYELADVTLAIRLHGAVFSAMAGTPVVGLEYLPKVRGFLARVGLESGCLALDEATPERIEAAVEHALGVDRALLSAWCRRAAQDVQRHAARAGAVLGLEPSVASAAA